jgi:hypothetical protein
MDTRLLEQAKVMIEYLSRGVEFAAALNIGIASLEATIKAIRIFFRRMRPPLKKTRFA